MNTELMEMKKLLAKYDIDYEENCNDKGIDFLVVRECDLGDNFYDYGEEPHDFEWREDIPFSIRDDIANSSCISFLSCCDCCRCAGW